MSEVTQSCECYVDLTKAYHTAQMAPAASMRRSEEEDIREQFEANPPSDECKEQLRALLQNSSITFDPSDVSVFYSRFGVRGWCEKRVENRYGNSTAREGTYTVYRGTVCDDRYTDDLSIVQDLLVERDQAFEENMRTYLQTNELPVGHMLSRMVEDMGDYLRFMFSF